MEIEGMKTHIVRIGNSQAVRIPKALLEQAGLSGEVEIRVEGNSLVIRAAAAAKAPRKNGADDEKVPSLPPYRKLRELARKHPPPQSWFDEEGKPF
jgi:antitoxin component of MazEF toxin-antitoxin module